MNSDSFGAGQGRRIFVATAIACLALAFSGCVSRPVDEAKLVGVPVSLGMSRTDLRSYFGEPLRIEANGDGSERWIYRVYTPSETEREVTESKTESKTEGLSGTEHSLEVSKTIVSWTTGGAREGVVHVSAAGVVEAPLPEGRIVRK